MPRTMDEWEDTSREMTFIGYGRVGGRYNSVDMSSKSVNPVDEFVFRMRGAEFGDTNSFGNTRASAFAATLLAEPTDRQRRD